MQIQQVVRATRGAVPMGVLPMNQHFLVLCGVIAAGGRKYEYF